MSFWPASCWTQQGGGGRCGGSSFALWRNSLKSKYWPSKRYFPFCHPFTDCLTTQFGASSSTWATISTFQTQKPPPVSVIGQFWSPRSSEHVCLPANCILSFGDSGP